MRNVEFVNCGEIRMGSPHHICDIRLHLKWDPRIPDTEFQDLFAESADGRFLALVRWSTQNNEPGFNIYILDNQKRTVEVSPRHLGCCEKIWWDGDFRWNSF